ncbi:MAG: hypothetical protein JWP01_2825 [Myxococcales bacterium]|nr:hypothetical protein [Myxococcales bacterium]
MLGGFLSGGPPQLVQVFDTADCAWSPGPSLPGDSHHVNAAVVDGTIHVVGALQGTSFTAVGVTWSWTPSTDPQWTVRAPMPAAANEVVRRPA